MRNVRSAVWLSIFCMGAAIPAFCQVIVPPNTSGRTIPSDAVTETFQESVSSTGTFTYDLFVFKGGDLEFTSSATVCTYGPLTTVSVDVPLGCFGLSAGQFVTFAFAVHHDDSEGNTNSAVISVVPVVNANPTTPSLPPPTTSSKVLRPTPGEFARWIRREGPSEA